MNVVALPGVTFKLARRIARARLEYAHNSFAKISSEQYFDMLNTLACLDPEHPLLKSPPDYPNSIYDFSQCFDALIQYHNEAI